MRCVIPTLRELKALFKAFDEAVAEELKFFNKAANELFDVNALNEVAEFKVFDELTDELPSDERTEV